MLLYQFFTNLTTYGFSNNSSIKQLELILLLIIILVMFIIYIISAIPSLKPKTKLEDVDFEKEFETHTTNEIECRYLLTPAFIERFNNIKMTFSARKISCSFYKNKVYLAIPTYKNLFEAVKTDKSLYEKKIFDNFINEFTSILILIDYFKLNKNTGL